MAGEQFPSLAPLPRPCTAHHRPPDGPCRFGADQFDESKPQEAKLIPRFFNWFYLAISCGAVLAATVVVNVQTKSCGAGKRGKEGGTHAAASPQLADMRGGSDGAMLQR